MAKLLKLRRGSTSAHASFTGAEGEVTIDTTKDTAVVHDGAQAGGRPLAREDMSNVSSANIAGQLGTDSIATTKIAAGVLPTDVTVASANLVNGTIVDADVNTSAAIAGTKISPDFGSQNISTTGTIASNDITISDTSPTINFVDSNHNPDYMIRNSDGGLIFNDTTNGQNRLVINTDGHVDVLGNLDCASGIDVTGGNITLPDAGEVRLGNSGDLQLYHDGNESYINDTGSGSLRIVTDSFQIRNAANSANRLTVASADGQVNIPNNLDVGAGVDVTGNITVTGTVDGRDVAADGTKLDGIDTGAKDDQTKAEIDALNINADTLDTLHASSFIRSDADDTISESNQVRFSCAGNIPTTSGSQAALEVYSGNGANTDAFMSFHVSSDYALYFGLDGGTNDLAVGGWSKGANSYKVWHAGNHGAGSGLDADAVDGIAGSSLLRSDANDTASGDITFAGGAGAVTVSGGSDIRLDGGAWTGEYTTGIKIQPDGNNSYFQYEGNLYHRNTSGDNRLTLDQSGNLTAVGNVTAYSDKKLKTDIFTINDALGICGKLRGVSYKWIATDKPSIGVIAQEVEEVLPEVVLTNRDTNPSTGETTEIKSVDYGKIVGVLINAINELKAEVDELKGGK